MLIACHSFVLALFLNYVDSQALPTLVVPNIGNLFTVPEGTRLTYPPLDIHGPQPRQEWVKAYQKAKTAGLIPSIPPSQIVDYLPVYPPSYHGAVCNPSLPEKCNSSMDVTAAPPGMAAISFDDGPQPDSLELLQYLQSQSQKATHFLIGSRILSNPKIFQALDKAGQHLAVHTYSHPMMTNMTDLQIVGELGWTMQVIHDSSLHNNICRFWRPPYGDTDERVEAIAKNVFGLISIHWDHDPRDWCLADSVPNGSACAPGNGPQTLAELQGALKKFVETTPKSQGLMILEHEHTQRTVAAFKYIFPIMKKLRWIPKAIPDLFRSNWYQ